MAPAFPGAALFKEARKEETGIHLPAGRPARPSACLSGESVRVGTDHPPSPANPVPPELHRPPAPPLAETHQWLQRRKCVRQQLAGRAGRRPRSGAGPGLGGERRHLVAEAEAVLAGGRRLEQHPPLALLLHAPDVRGDPPSAWPPGGFTATPSAHANYVCFVGSIEITIGHTMQCVDTYSHICDERARITWKPGQIEIGVCKDLG